MEIIFGQLLQTFGDFFWSHWLGSSCITFGRSVASDTRDLQFKSSHEQILYFFNCIETTKTKKWRLEISQFLKTGHADASNIHFNCFQQCVINHISISIYDLRAVPKSKLTLSANDSTKCGRESCNQCDQIGRFFGLWTTF